MHAWSQLTSFGFSLVGLILAAMPRASPETFTGSSLETEWPARRLRYFPVFWLGLVGLIYVVVQGANPAWRFLSNADSWWLEPVRHFSWLPSSVSAPFALSNPWRTLAVFTSAWLLVGSIWAGFSRRQSYRILFFVLAGNIFVLGALAALQRSSGTELIFWSYPSNNPSFFASFIYPNHAGAYFGLMVALAAAMACWCQQHRGHFGVQRWHGIFFATAAVCAGSLVVCSYSRGSIISLFVFVTLLGAGLSWRLLRGSGRLSARPEWIPVLLVGAVFFVFGVIALRSEKIAERFAGLMSDPTTSMEDRSQARAAAADMFADHWITGWGAGSFRYGFQAYVAKYPDIYRLGTRGHRYWEHAHNDWLEYAVELGVVGLLPLAGILAYVTWQLGRQRWWRNVAAVSLVFGCGLTLAHGWIDFVFQSPAIFLTWCVLLTAAVRWIELDQIRPRRT